MRILAIILFRLVATSIGNDSSSATHGTYSFDYEYISGEIEGRLAGGNEIEMINFETFNYQVGMLSWNKNGKQSLCGGALVHRKVILTAAHCVVDSNMVGVFMGTRIKPKNFNDGGNIIVYKRDIVCHENYGMGSFSEDDIAIVFLPREAILSQYIGIIPIATSASNCQNGKAWISGWGRRRNEPESTAEIMNWAEVKAASTEECLAIYYKELVLEKQICSSGYNSIGICEGDSGGPFAFEDSNGKRVLCGLNSYARGDCISSNPRVHTAVSYYYENNWICNNSRGLINCV